jgi:hypothetical protein
MTRSAWLGAGFAIALAATLVAFGGGASKPSASSQIPAPSQAPAPTLDPVIQDSRTQPSASPEAPSQATSSHKESK